MILEDLVISADMVELRQAHSIKLAYRAAKSGQSAEAKRFQDTAFCQALTRGSFQIDASYTAGIRSKGYFLGRDETNKRS